MSSLKTCACLAALVIAAPVGANARDNIVDLFAGCAGRLSAELEHQWLMYDAGAEDTEAVRRDVLTLLDSVMPRGDAAQGVLSLRLDAKFAHAGLLQRATFNDDADSAAWARRRADAQVAECRALVRHDATPHGHAPETAMSSTDYHHTGDADLTDTATSN